MGSSTIVGRGPERLALQEAIRHPAVRAIALRGGAGQGKTSLALQAAKGVQGAFVGYGKHADDASGGGTRALGEALRSLLEQGLEQLYDVEIGLSSLREALGASVAALVALDRDLFADVLADTAPPLSAGAAAERLGLAVERLLRWMEGFRAPLVLVLDDWGRASPSTRRLYARLAASGAHAATLLGTERDAQASGVAGDRVVDLAPLTAADLQTIAALHLDGDASTAATLVDLFGEVLRTPLALKQSLELLVRAGALARTEGGWVLDAGAAAALLGPDAAAALVRRSGRDAPELRRVLQATVVAGDRAGVDELAAVTGLPPERVREAAASADAPGLLQLQAEELRVVHDTIRSAVLADTAPEERRRLAQRWATHLAGSADLRGVALETALRLRLESGLDTAEPAAWIDRFVAGAAAARTAGAAETARAYAAAAVELEERTGAATFAVAQEAAQAALQAGDLDAGDLHTAQMRERARSEEERLLAAEAALVCARLSGRAVEGLRLARDAIARQGLGAPERVSLSLAAAAIVQLRLTPDKPTPTRLRPDSALYRVLNTAGYMTFELEPRAAVVLSARAALFAPLRGTAYAAGLRATLACLSGDWNAALRWGRVGFDRLDRAEPLRAPALHLTLQFGAGLAMGAADTSAACERLQALAVEEGDLGMAAYANRDRALASMRGPATLDAHRRTLANCRAAAERFEDPVSGPMISALEQMACNLAEGGPRPWRLQGDIFDSPSFERSAGEETRQIATAFLLLEAMLANAFGAWETTLSIHERMEGRFDAVRHHPWIGAWTFHTGLARARLGLPMARWERVGVARHGRMNASLSHRHLALEAERRLAQHRADDAMVAYDRALHAAEAAGFHLEAGIVATAAVAAARAAGRREAAGRFAAGRDAMWRAMGAEGALAATLGPDAGALATAVKGGSAEERAVRAKTRLLAEAAHELRTPMQGIQGLLDLAGDDPAGLDLPRVREAFAGLRNVVDDLTDLGAVESERLSVVDAAFSPLRVLETETLLARRTEEGRGRLVSLDASGDAQAPMRGDAGRLAQIVRNLVGNALRYSDGEVEVGLALEPSRLVVEVADRGPGLSQADLTRLFQPFVRGDASRRAEGSGLGLALSRRLAERMGGQLTGANREGGGALFRLELPRRTTEAAAPAGPPPPRLLRVLLAEDVELSRETMARLLRARGHAVTAVADGEAALRAGRTGAFDALVLDARMPRLGGCDALARLREAGCGVPALIVTAATDPELAARLERLPPARLVRKPLAAEELYDLLEASAGAGAAAWEPPREQVLAELALRRQAIEAALRQERLERVRELAHAAAGLAAEFRLPDSEALFGALEAAAKRGDAHAVGRLLDGATVGAAADVDGL